MTKRNLAAILAMAAACALVSPAAYAQEHVLRVGMNVADVTNLDAHRATSTGDVALVGWMYNGLMRFAPGSADPATIEPDLAESWTTSSDGLVWTFKIRPDVKFHGDYGTVTAEDVVYSLKRASNKDTSSFAADYSSVSSIEAVGDMIVEIKLNAPVPGFLGLVANYHGGNIVSKKAAEEMGDEFNAHPIGTGPFMFDEKVTQQYVRLVANKDYFRGAPKIDQIMYQLIPSDSSRQLAFESGELDLIIGKRDQKWVEDAKNIEGAVVDVFEPGEFRTLHINTTHGDLADPRIRLALAEAINVEELRAFVGTDITRAGCSVVPPGYLGENCDAGAYPYDPANAKKLLEEAGFGGGLTLHAVVSNNSAQQPVMEVIQAQLSQVGINVDMEIVDHPTYHEKIRQDASDLVFYGAARFPVADSYLSQFYHSSAIVGTPTAITNFSHCSVADKEIDAAKTNPIDADRLALWKEAQVKIHEDVCSVPLFSLMQVWLHSDKLDYGFPMDGSLNLAPVINEQTMLN